MRHTHTHTHTHTSANDLANKLLIVEVNESEMKH